MATQYSILSVLIRPEIQEKISVGLIMFDNEEVYFSFSEQKLSSAKNLLSGTSYKLLKDILENIESKIHTDSNSYSVKRGFKIFKNKVFDTTFNSNYISYLSRYSNNLLAFSEPKEIRINVSTENFEKLYTKYIDDSINEVSDIIHKRKPIEIIQMQFGVRVTEHFDIERDITSELVPNLISPVKIDFAGRNQIDFYAQTVDMEGRSHYVSNNINAFIQLKTIYQQNRVGLKDYIIASEPNKLAYPNQHAIWVQLKNTSLLNYIDLSESEKIIEYAEQHNVIPISKTEQISRM
jgi:hypothetical protein